VARSAQAAGDVIGARYTAVMDKSTFAASAEADDGVLGAFDDPVRPAQTHQTGRAPGGGNCRCIEVFQLASDGRVQQ
jgi:hypothetical protein